MNRSAARHLVETTTIGWVEDEAVDVVWAGDYEGTWGIRLAQQARDFTTVWFDVGDLTVRAEAYVLPAPPHNGAAFYRYCLAKNASAWPVAFEVDRRGDLFIAGRVPLARLAPETLDGIVGAIYAMVDASFRTLVRIGFQNREKSS